MTKVRRNISRHHKKGIVSWQITVFFLLIRNFIVTSFADLHALPAEQLTNLNELGYLTMTPVQEASLPAILAGKDVRAQAKTGSGKTAAFGLGLLQRIDAK